MTLAAGRTASGALIRARAVWRRATEALDDRPGAAAPDQIWGGGAAWRRGVSAVRDHPVLTDAGDEQAAQPEWSAA